MALIWEFPNAAVYTPDESALHSHANPDWISPPAYVEAAREVMGSIDLDPMSDIEAQAIVKATRYYNAVQNGLTQPWDGNVFINPAGGLVTEAWQKLMHSFEVKQFIWIGYSLEQLQTLQGAVSTKTFLRSPLDFPMCIPRRRIAFLENEAKKAARIAKAKLKGKVAKEIADSPSHANYVVYYGPHTVDFGRVFKQFGECRLFMQLLA